jgi:tRNA(Ile)-lysidine synthase
MPPRNGLAGARDVEVIRPMLRARKSDIFAHLERRSVPFSEDPSNTDPRFLRTRVRHEVLPLLTRLSPGIVEHLSALADELEVGRGAAARPDERLGDGPTDWTAALPRRTRAALRALLQSRSASARVWLPGGLVVAIGENGNEKRPARARKGQN